MHGTAIRIVNEINFEEKWSRDKVDG